MAVYVKLLPISPLILIFAAVSIFCKSAGKYLRRWSISFFANRRPQQYEQLFSVAWNTGLNTFAIDSLTEGTYSVSDRQRLLYRNRNIHPHRSTSYCGSWSKHNQLQQSYPKRYDYHFSQWWYRKPYLWNSDGNTVFAQNNTGMFGNLTPGCYSVKIIDGNLCYFEIPNLCWIGGLPLTIHTTVSDESCSGFVDGSIVVDSLSSGILPLPAEWILAKIQMW